MRGEKKLKGMGVWNINDIIWHSCDMKVESEWRASKSTRRARPQGDDGEQVGENQLELCMYDNNVRKLAASFMRC